MLGVGVVPPAPSSFCQNHSSHPCWPKGYSTRVLLGEVYESPCTSSLRPHSYNSSATVGLSGSSSLALCRDLVSGLFSFSSCRFSRCSFNGVFQPPVAGNFIVSPGAGVEASRLPSSQAHGSGCRAVGLTALLPQAFSAFFYTVDFLRTVMGLPVATLQQLEAAVATVCNQTWDEVSLPPLLQACTVGGGGCSASCMVCPHHLFALQAEGDAGLSEHPLWWGRDCYSDSKSG